MSCVDNFSKIVHNMKFSQNFDAFALEKNPFFRSPQSISYYLCTQRHLRQWKMHNWEDAILLGFRRLKD